MSAPATTEPPPTRRRDPASLLRSGLLGIAVISAGAVAYELATERHWRNPTQLVPWAALAVLLVAIALAWSPRTTAVVRVLAVAVLLTSAFGITEHVLVNIHKGQFSSYGPAFKQLPALERLWLGATKSVGSAPPLAPGALGQAALLVLLSTVGRRR